METSKNLKTKYFSDRLVVTVLVWVSLLLPPLSVFFPQDLCYYTPKISSLLITRRHKQLEIRTNKRQEPDVFSVVHCSWWKSCVQKPQWFCLGLLKLNKEWYLFIILRVLPVIYFIAMVAKKQIATKEVFFTKMNEHGGFHGKSGCLWWSSGEMRSKWGEVVKSEKGLYFYYGADIYGSLSFHRLGLQ